MICDLERHIFYAMIPDVEGLNDMKPESHNDSAETPELPWAVYVDDNFHYMDESERLLHGRFASLEEALTACMAITQSSVEEHGTGYTNFGEDPWVMPRPAPDELATVLAAHPEWPAAPFAGGYFSAWTYAGLIVPETPAT